MTIEFTRTGPPLAEVRLAEVAGSALPTDYRRFMLAQNGGVLGEIAHLPDDDSGASVRAFLSIDADDDSYDLADTLRTYDGRYPQGLLPIAFDASSNLILLDIGYQQSGSVWFWDHDGEADENEPPRTDNIVKIADTFTGFLRGLTTGFTPEEEALIAEMVAGGTARKGPYVPPGGFTFGGTT
ncbi:SMI1/KNR4 family protein [Aeromicrobium sp. 50.2.37]|uniref:SMI1/KNR4 family protein n=1 Tax=Aeromicrobium sp. 50.2.37 TaxID=2969305 RepID=UPI0021505541|nr:SMI1/KNR4 family protein [Aeromicrobium sp. 50.2.37]MCR4512555.1 SMI1/KNR4 family protein [Aeromicrobium sp. 50.2.37]